MSDKYKTIHTAYASKPSRIYSVKAEIKSNKGIKTTGLSKAMLAKQLSMLV